MRVLLHTCCGPCSCYPVRSLRREGHDLTALFYNPNIHPYREFERRLDTLRQFAEGEGLEVIVRDDFDIHSYLRGALEAPTKRDQCRLCYAPRLGEAAREARERGFDAFSTTLLVSPYQDHESVRDAGEAAAAGHGVGFLYRDFRPGWRETMEAARLKGLYRQGYCGCIFSEAERYRRQGRSG
ncbi:MAG: epoxyqueuosine reductase QueH [Bacillota bacterium]